MEKRIANVSGHAWLCLLGLALLVSARATYYRAVSLEEYAGGCDAFGYLLMADEIRAAVAQRREPGFHLETPHTRALIEFFTAHNEPLNNWSECIAPHAHHYFPAANAVGVQYPPGTGLMLALFPPGRAVHDLTRLDIMVTVLLGLGLLVWSAVRRAWWSAGLAILALHFGLTVLARLSNASFSLNALFVPLLLAILLSLAARNGERRAVWWAGLAGLAFGWAVLIRLPVLFLLPGLLLLHLPWPWSLRQARRALVFVGGFLLSGIAPLLWFQRRNAGGWLLSTYSSIDNTPPSLEFLAGNWIFYFGGGAGSVNNWGLYAALPGVLGCVALLWRRTDFSLWRILLAALLVFAGPAAYFLTHAVAIHYYLTPSLLGAVWLLAGGIFLAEMSAPQETLSGFTLSRSLLILLALAPGLVVLAQAWTLKKEPAITAAQPRALAMPQELSDERAWLWSDELSGTFWYYAQRPAYKITFTTPAVRARLFRLAHERNEPQYLVADSPGMSDIVEEVRALGGQATPRGEVAGYPYFLLVWPITGPQE